MVIGGGDGLGSCDNPPLCIHDSTINLMWDSETETEPWTSRVKEPASLSVTEMIGVARITPAFQIGEEHPLPYLIRKVVADTPSSELPAYMSHTLRKSDRSVCVSLTS